MLPQSRFLNGFDVVIAAIPKSATKENQRSHIMFRILNLHPMSSAFRLKAYQTLSSRDQESGSLNFVDSYFSFFWKTIIILRFKEIIYSSTDYFQARMT